MLINFFHPSKKSDSGLNKQIVKERQADVSEKMKTFAYSII